jgi:hypothetical protein
VVAEGPRASIINGLVLAIVGAEGLCGRRWARLSWETIVGRKLEVKMSNVNAIPVIGRMRGASRWRREANLGLQRGVEGFDTLA